MTAALAVVTCDWTCWKALSAGLDLVVDLLRGELRHQLPALHVLPVLHGQPLDAAGGRRLQVGLGRRLHHPGRADVLDHLAGADDLGGVAVVAAGGAGTEGERDDQAQGGGSPGRPVPHPPPLPSPYDRRRSA